MTLREFNGGSFRSNFIGLESAYFLEQKVYEGC